MVCIFWRRLSAVRSDGDGALPVDAVNPVDGAARGDLRARLPT